MDAQQFVAKCDSLFYNHAHGGVDLLEMSKRLRPDQFQQYLDASRVLREQRKAN